MTNALPRPFVRRSCNAHPLLEFADEVGVPFAKIDRTHARLFLHDQFGEHGPRPQRRRADSYGHAQPLFRDALKRLEGQLAAWSSCCNLPSFSGGIRNVAVSESHITRRYCPIFVSSHTFLRTRTGCT